MTTNQTRPSITLAEISSPRRHQPEVMTFSQSLSSAFDWSLGLLSMAETSDDSDELGHPRNSTSNSNGNGFDAFYDTLGEDGVAAIVDKDNFRQLQKALRNRGCVTNVYLQQNIGKYVHRVVAKKQQQLLEEAEATQLGSGPTSPGTHAGGSLWSHAQ